MLPDTMLDKFTTWGQSRPDVRAIILTSSLAGGKTPVDLLSDYDPILILSDIHPYVEDRSWLADFGPVLAVYADPLIDVDGLTRSAYVVQYENGLKIDFNLWPVEMLQRVAANPVLPEEFDASYRVLLDKDNLTVGLKPPTFQGYIPKPPTEKFFHDEIESFFLDSMYVAKFLWRGDLVAAKHILDHHMKHEHIVLFMWWHIEIASSWSIKPGPYGRRLQNHLRPDLWADLAATYTPLDPASTWDAFDKTIILMRRVATEIADSLGFTYPEDLHRRAMTYLEKIRRLPPGADKLP